MKTLKVLFLMFMVTGFLVSCGGESTEAPAEEAAADEAEEEAKD